MNGLPDDALLALFSTGKGAAHLVVAPGAGRRARARRECPGLLARARHRVTLRQLLAHQAGLIGVDGGLTVDELADDQMIAARLATQPPYWEPGSAYGNHAFVVGALLGEVVRRITGQTLQEVYESRVRSQLELDFFLGLPDSEEPRYQPVRPMLGSQPAQPPGSLTAIAFNTPTDLVDFANRRAVRANGPASAGSVGSARGVARMYAAMLGPLGDRPALIDPLTDERDVALGAHHVGHHRTGQRGLAPNARAKSWADVTWSSGGCGRRRPRPGCRAACRGDWRAASRAPTTGRRPHVVATPRRRREQAGR